MKLQTYIVGIPGEEEGHWDECKVVCAESPEHALRLAHSKTIARNPEWVGRVLGDETDYEIERYPEADALATEPKVIRDESLLRPFGWHYADDRQCEGCDEWSEGTCSECCLCPECRDGECEHCRGPL